MLPEIKVSCSLAKKKVKLQSIEKNSIKLYACGVTVYDDCHIGHAMQAIYFDMIRNFLRYAGYQVTYVRNYTDVDDKIIDRAKKLGISPKELSEKIIASCTEDFQKLGLKPADFEPKVSESIPDIIAMIEVLIDKGFAYPTSDGDVYYRVREKKDYGKLSNRSLEGAQTGNRQIVEGEKEELVDFALWKKEDIADASWESPWGRGRPGWHIECSAMAKKCLGPSIDIHGGGRDLIFPHHENEIAQSEAANSCNYASSWIHSGLLTINKQKMSKSLGNSITIKDFLKTWPAEVLQLSFLQNHYASPVDFSEEVFQKSLKRLLYYYQTVLELAREQETGEASQGKNPIDAALIRKEFVQVMADDFNTPEAFVVLNKIFKLANQKLSTGKGLGREHSAECLALIREFAEIFNLLGNEPARFIEELKLLGLKSSKLSASEIEGLLQARHEARQNKDWGKSDKIRDQLLAQGISINDKRQSTDWFFTFEQKG